MEDMGKFSYCCIYDSVILKSQHIWAQRCLDFHRSVNWTSVPLPEELKEQETLLENISYANEKYKEYLVKMTESEIGRDADRYTNLIMTTSLLLDEAALYLIVNFINKQNL